MDIGTIDLGILIFLILFTSLWGFLGASRIVLTLTSVFVITTLIYNSPRFAGLFGSGLLGKILLSLFVLFLSLIFFGILARIIPSAIKGITKLGPYDKILGLIIGAILGIYICGFLVWGIEQYGGLIYNDLSISQGLRSHLNTSFSN